MSGNEGVDSSDYRPLTYVRRGCAAGIGIPPEGGLRQMVASKQLANISSDRLSPGKGRQEPRIPRPLQF